jgi:hypothetical protein
VDPATGEVGAASEEEVTSLAAVLSVGAGTASTEVSAFAVVACAEGEVSPTGSVGVADEMGDSEDAPTPRDTPALTTGATT